MVAKKVACLLLAVLLCSMVFAFAATSNLGGDRRMMETGGDLSIEGSSPIWPVGDGVGGGGTPKSIGGNETV